jgi:tRNA(Ile)-lysidine synthase
MLRKVRQWIHRHRLIGAGDRVLAACSGGPDSMALVHILLTLGPEYGFTLAVGHMNHMLRGEESAEDERFVETFCHRHHVPFYRTAVNVRRFAQETGKSVEDAARIVRYDWLRKQAFALGGAKIATGHHRDDQAETVLINLLRGAGSAGLRGMQPESGGIIRPLLTVSRREIAAYCAEHKLNPRTDSTNSETDYVRNRIRLQLLPYLEKEYNPAVREALWRTAVLLSDEHSFIRKAADGLWPQVAQENGNSIILDGNLLLEQHNALQREIFRLAIEKKRGSLKGISFFHVEKLIYMVETASVGSVMELPGGLLAKKSYSGVEIGYEKTAKPMQTALSGTKIDVPGETCITQFNIKIIASILPMCPQSTSPMTAVFDRHALMPPLYVRTRLPGDRFKPVGLNGTKKLKDFFIDEKVPRCKRDEILIFCDGGGIIWVSGYRQAEYARVNAHTTEYLQLTIEPMNSTGGALHDS